MSLTLEKVYVVLECLACNLLQISPLKLCPEKLRFIYMCFQNAGNAISETQILKISWGGMLPDPLAYSCLRYSAPTFGDRILSLGVGVQGKWALL
jgi:hypothetical protein